MTTRWRCPVCGLHNPAGRDYCTWCRPVLVPRPTPAPDSLPAAAVEVMRHIAAVLRGMRAELETKRLSAAQLGVKGYGLKQLCEQIGHSAERLEKELEK